MPLHFSDESPAASSPEKLERLYEIGADEGINYTTQNFESELIAKHGKPRARGPGAGVDVVVNFTGGDTWVPSLKVLKKRRTDADMRCHRRFRSQDGYPLYPDI